MAYNKSKARERLKVAQRKILLEALERSGRESLISPHEKITLLASNKPFQVHPPVLTAGSTYFKDIFENHYKEKIPQTLHIKNLEGYWMDIILDFLYTGSVELMDERNDNSIYGVIAAAKSLGIDLLYSYCRDLLVYKMGSSNRLDILWKNAEESGYTGFKAKITEYVARNFKNVSENSDFMSHLTSQDLDLVITNPCYRATNDTLISTILERVTNLQPEEKATILSRLMLLGVTKDISNLSLAHMLAWEETLEQGHFLNLLLPRLPERFIDNQIPPLIFGPHLVCFRKLKFDHSEVYQDYVAMYSILDATWLPSQKMPFWIDSGMAVVKCEERVYFIGGARRDKECLSKTVHSYSPTLNAVTDVGHLVRAVYLAGAGVLQNMIYVLGGWMCDDEGHLVASCVVQKYDPVKRVTEEVTSCLEHPDIPFVATADPYLFVVSFKDSVVQQYDSSADCWTVIRPEVGEICWGVAALDRKLYVMQRKTPEELQVYDLELNSWSTLFLKDAPIMMPGLWTLPRLHSDQGPLLLFRAEGYELHTFQPQTGEWDILLDSKVISDPIFCLGLYDIVW